MAAAAIKPGVTVVNPHDFPLQCPGFHSGLSRAEGWMDDGPKRMLRMTCRLTVINMKRCTGNDDATSKTHQSKLAISKQHLEIVYSMRKKDGREERRLLVRPSDESEELRNLRAILIPLIGADEVCEAEYGNSTVVPK